MKKGLIIAGSILLIIIGLLTYKNWQKKAMLKTFKQPSLQTMESLKSLKNQNNLPGIMLIPKNQEGFDFLRNYLSEGTIFVLDEHNKVIECNFENIGGLCYADVVKGINKGYNFNTKKQFPLFDSLNFYETLLASTVTVHDNDMQTLEKPYKYKILYGWVSYIPISFSPKQMGFSPEAIENQDVLFVGVSSDYVNNWFGDDSTLIPSYKFE
ncbi:MAG TPA: hypothetical protein VLZ83_10040 [Edaphocola sp.]|nr:hypothetical protein [Edaphocola sp.]